MITTGFIAGTVFGFFTLAAVGVALGVIKIEWRL